MEKPPEKQEEDNVIRSLDDPRVQQILENIEKGVVYRIVPESGKPFAPLTVQLSGSEGMGFFDTFEFDEKPEQ